MKHYRTKKRKKENTKRLCILSVTVIGIALILTSWIWTISPLQIEADNNSQLVINHRETPPQPKISLSEGVIREVTAYNAGDPAQTDSSPCTSANGENICLALELGYKRCASNAFPFGTRLQIENYGECMVVDRMNSRYSSRVDIAMKKEEKQRAINFGLQKLVVAVIN